MRQSPTLGAHTHPHPHAHGFWVGMGSILLFEGGHGWVSFPGGYGWAYLPSGYKTHAHQYCLRPRPEHGCHVNTSSLAMVVSCMF
jgi:hypothetical protein